MSILTKQQIIDRIKGGEIAFQPPLDSLQLQAHSIDLRLGNKFLVPRMWQITERGREALATRSLEQSGQEAFETITLSPGQHFDLLPQEHVLVSSLETIKVPSDLMSVLYPRSSTNRKGLSVDLTGIIDSGYEGSLILPIRNNTRSQIIRLHPGERFCQLVFEELTETVQIRQSRYHNRDISQGALPDKEQEIKYILDGDIDSLKKNFPI